LRTPFPHSRPAADNHRGTILSPPQNYTMQK
jgi:hypothetical protein